MCVKIHKTEQGFLSVSSPYHPDFAPAAKKLGGKWDSAGKTWRFDVRDEERVRELCRSIYGTDGSPATGPAVTVRITAKEDVSAFGGGLYFAGRSLAYATGRDSGARLGEGVILLAGRATSGGSVKNWTTRISAGSVLEVRDLPEAAVAQAEASASEDWTIERIEAGNDKRAALEAEREVLQARLAAIETELASM